MLISGFRCVHRALGGLAGLAAAALTSGLAAAQTPPAPAAAPEAALSAEPAPTIQLTPRKPMIDLATPPPSAPEGREYHNHDGLSVRVNVGVGALIHGAIKSDAGDANTSGLTLGYDLLIGGSPAPGFTLGGAVTGSLQLTGSWDDNRSGNLNTVVIGPFAEGYPDSHGNLHFGATVGFARVGYDTGENGSALGVGGAFWAGSGVWVAPDWSVGGLLRLDAAYGKDADITATAVGVSLMFSVLYQ
jgi:hypothetical protein